MKLDLCSGTHAPQRKAEGYLTLDARPFPGVDAICHLGDQPLPFPANVFDELRAADALEHISGDLFGLMDECWRVLRPGGEFRIVVPRFPSTNALLHPEHCRYFMTEADAAPFARALAPLIEGRVQRLFVAESFSFFQVPADGLDPHGYLQHFWHLLHLNPTPERLWVQLTPNKPGGRFPYQRVTRLGGGPTVESEGWA